MRPISIKSIGNLKTNLVLPILVDNKYYQANKYNTGPICVLIIIVDNVVSVILPILENMLWGTLHISKSQFGELSRLKHTFCKQRIVK